MPDQPNSAADGYGKTIISNGAGVRGVVVCRAFVEADRQACQEIAAEAAASSYATALPDIADSFGPDAPLEPADRRWVAVLAEQVIGFIDLVGNHIANLFVAPAVQGRGVGRLLIAAVEQETCGDLTLSVFTVNPRAKALYECLGFAVESEGLAGFHGIRTAVWRMRKARPLTPRYRLVVFDFDGVLADSADWMLRTLPLIIDEFGLNRKTADELQDLRSAPTRNVVRALGAPAWKIPFIARRLRQLSEASASDIGVFPRVVELFDGLRAADVTTAVVSSNSETAVRAVLGRQTIDRIDHLDCGVGLFGKAARLRKLVRRLGVSPAEGVYVGDETRDIEAARRTGLDSAAVTWGYGTREVLAEHSPTVLAETVSDLRRCLGL